jgi:hypothetical protein
MISQVDVAELELELQRRAFNRTADGLDTIRANTWEFRRSGAKFVGAIIERKLGGLRTYTKELSEQSYSRPCNAKSSGFPVTINLAHIAVPWPRVSISGSPLRGSR